MIDGAVRIEEIDVRLRASDDRFFGEVKSGSTIDHDEEANVLICDCFGHALLQLRVLGDGVNLILHILSPEKFLHGAWHTARILRVHSESMSSPQKRTTETWAMFSSFWSCSKRTRMSLRLMSMII
jgi:hypothetical protein